MLRTLGDRPASPHIPDRSRKATAITFARVFIGVLWLFEVTLGHNWKIGGFGSGPNPGWIGPGAGDTVRANIAEAVEDGTWSGVAWLYQTVIEPNAAAFGYLVIALQVALGLFFIFGFAVRPMALAALTFDLSIFFLGNSRIPPFFMVTHLFLLYTGAGRYYGVDGWLLRRLREVRHRAARLVRWVIDLPLLTDPRAQRVVLGTMVVVAGYFFMQVAVRSSSAMSMVAMELAVLSGLVAAGFCLGRAATDRLAVVAALLRIFVGYRLLQEIWVRADPGVNSLPGWAGVDAQRDVFETIVDSHWAPFSWIVQSAFLPVLGLWVVLFGILQFATGVALVLGYRTRLAAGLALLYVGGLGVLGFTRIGPFLFGLLVVVLALDSGRALSLEHRRLADRGPRYGLPVPRSAVLPLTVLAAATAVGAAVAVVATGGVIPDGYVASMGQMTMAMVAIFAALFALGGWLQLRDAHEQQRQLPPSIPAQAGPAPDEALAEDARDHREEALQRE